VQYRDLAGNESATVEKSIQLDFYPAQPASSNYQLHKDVAALSGGTHQSSSYHLSGTGGQTLASGSAASSSNYRATLGFWPLRHTATTPPEPRPVPPTLLAPTDGITLTDRTVTFSWRDGDAPQLPAQEFLVEVRDTTGTVIQSSGWMAGTAWTAPMLNEGTYQWLVKARAAGQESTWSSVRTFTIDTTEPSTEPPELISDYTVGAPGSNFVFTASHFPAGSETVISVKAPETTEFVEVYRFTVPNNGTFVFVIYIPPSAAAGNYTVRVATQLPGMALAQSEAIELEQVLTIEGDGTAHNGPPPADAPVIPAIPEDTTLYLPLVVR
jgi:hypothetical protein